jgi:tetratricopeptide (TPR) repeat protein
MIGQLANVVLSKALYLHCAGDTQKSIDLLRNLIKLLEGSKPYLPMAKVDLTTRLAFANSHLISKLRFIGCHDEADAMEEEFLGSNHDPETDWIRAAQEIQRVTDLRHVLKNAPEDTSLAGSGISPEDYLEKIERDVEDFRKKGDQYNWLRASFQYAELLVDYGFYPEASEILEAGINEAREKRLNRHLLKLLGVRARLKMEMGDYGDLEADYFEILNLTRVQGLKIDELVVYRSYSIFLMESERYEDAINIMRTLLNVEKIFKRESRIALIHARIAEIEMILGNHSEAERLWSVIDARPRITLCPSANRELSFRIARLKYLKRKGNEAEFDEYHAATVDFVEKSELSGLEKRLFLERDFVLPHPEAGRNRIEEVGAEKAPLIQPTLMTTRVAVGESARGRFYLSNLETQSLEGELRVNGKLRSQS